MDAITIAATGILFIFGPFLVVLGAGILATALFVLPKGRIGHSVARFLRSFCEYGT